MYYVVQKWMETNFWIFFVGSDCSCEKVCIKATLRGGLSFIQIANGEKKARFVRRSWRGSNPRRPTPEEWGMPALTSRPRRRGIIHEIWGYYERQSSLRRPAKRSFGRANSGLFFQSAQYVDKYSSPLPLLFYADNFILKSTEHTTPSIVSTSYVFLNISESFSSQVTLCPALISVSVLNLHEEERQKPENWIPIGWIPCFDDEKARCFRPGQGYESCNARKNRLFHYCFCHLLHNWDDDTRDP
jgi:hypothetical protein